MPQAVTVSDLIGVPFVDGGRDPRRGLDCYGLVLEVMRRFGYALPEWGISCFDSAAIAPAARQTLAELFVPASGPGPGRIVVFSLDPERPADIQHFGVCLSRNKFIQTLHKTGCIRTDLSHRYWGQLAKGYYAWSE